MAELRYGRGKLVIVEGDITAIPADTIVNAANAALAGGGGVDGAIHRVGGPGIMAELRELHPRGTPTGTAVATGAGHLAARWVIHAVGPVWRGGDQGEPALLASAYRAAFTLAERLGAGSVTFPALSAGAYGYPPGEAAEIALRTVAAELEASRSVNLVTFVLRGETIRRAFADALAALARDPDRHR